MSEKLTYALEGDVAVLTLDDGKANALAPDMIDALSKALDRAESEAGAVAFFGRPGRFSAGFDLKTMSAGADAAAAMVGAGAELLLRIYEFPRPTVVGVTGHALAAGALILCAADTRIATRGDFKIGLNEVAIGMTLPVFGTELARDRLSKRHFTAAVVQATLYDAEGAVAAGYADRAVDADALVGEVMSTAATLAELPRGAYAGTKRQARNATAGHIRDSLVEDMARLKGAS
ncbi:MAG: crotonase/enoyl-CoA hydratase family protein [Deltaproteobacteria bacterium]|nr:crotonase/enoyl-CoA hydratase family protein [Deltaproteobacteria bacterium]MBW2445631.1 crotonase/enoyl-CoA hydratase family protein [Deltaproteobacteria bacterium]